MLIDGRKVPAGSKVTADVVIVGAGPAGLAIAKELESTNLNIIIIEAGSTETIVDPDSGKFPGPKGFTYDLAKHRTKGIGGSSRFWVPAGWQAFPMEAVDFEECDCIPYSGWPIAYEELTPHFKKALELCKLGPMEFDSEFWMQWETQRPSFFVSTDVIKTCMMQFGDPKVFENLQGHLDKSATIKVYLNSRVAQIKATENHSQVVGLEVKSRAGNSFEVEARTYILATGGVENARLLLASNIGNDHDLVGRYFMEHIHVKSGGIRFFDPKPLTFGDFYRPHKSGTAPCKVKGQLKLTEEAIRAKQLGNAVIWVYSIPQAYLDDGMKSLIELFRERNTSIPMKVRAGHVLNILKDSWKILPVAAQQLLRGRLPETALKVVIEAEQVPNPDSRVRLGDELDSFGLPIANVEWKLTDFDLDSIRKTQEVLDSELRRLNIGYVDQMYGDEWPSAILAGGSHHMGTTRMDDSPTSGVVDPNSRVHGVSNLYVAGSSVFPTGGGCNPTLTLLALAFRLAEHVKSELTVPSLV